ncbi:hypothetical protein RND81_04G077600 [Saponaria officinalis]|uniref:CRIB domain-containing protein n=1 Tax=Saponaria officinalis TaxID=3572 RepID=A0AAW1LII1_SAPOF
MATKFATTTTATKDSTSTEIEEVDQNQLSLLALLLSAIRKTLVYCRVDRSEEVISAVQMEIGLPTDVHHITHVTFDRFRGFLGLPLEFQVEIPRKVPSARISVFLYILVANKQNLGCSAVPACIRPKDILRGALFLSVFGVSAKSMQCSHDPKGNTVPIILLLMQERLYSVNGLKAYIPRKCPRRMG